MQFGFFDLWFNESPAIANDLVNWSHNF